MEERSELFNGWHRGRPPYGAQLAQHKDDDLA